MFHKAMRWAALPAVMIAVSAQAAGDTSYVNDNWGYAVTLPGEVRLIQNTPPAPNHGFGVRVAKRAYLWVDGSSSDGENLAETVKESTGFLLRDEDCVVLERAADSLGGKPAQRLVLRCPADKPRTGTELRRTVIALAAPPGHGAAAYSVNVTYPEDGGAEARRALALFDDAQRGFRFLGKR